MALVLGARIGDRFLVGDRSLTVTSINGNGGATLRRDDGTSAAIYVDHKAEVLPGVFVFLGEVPGTQNLRLAFDASPAINILRRGAA